MLINILFLLTLINTTIIKRELNYDEIVEMLCEVNQIRQKYGAKPLMIDPRLMDVAESHSLDQSRNNRLSHKGSNGSKLSDRSPFSSSSENVAYNFGDVDSVMKSWLNSPGHFKNIIDKQHNILGLGKNKNYWTQVFAYTPDTNLEKYIKC